GGGIAAPAAPISPAALSATANPALIDAGQFGAGFVSMRATTFPGGAGVFWPTFSVSDASANGFASVNYSRGEANFVSVVNASGLAGTFLAVRGHLGGPEAFVAAALRGTFFIDNQPVGPLDVVIASDGAGPRQDFVTCAPGAGVCNFSRIL